MKPALSALTLVLGFLAIGCGTSSTTVTGPSLDRCSITVVNSMSSVGASGGSGRLTVTTGRECTWSVTSNVPWITPSPPAGGQGNGTVDFVVTANPSTEARRGTVAMGGQVLEVVQEGLTCSFDLKPASQNIGAEGGSGSIAVEAPGGCNWTASANAPWISIVEGATGGGNGTVRFTVQANPGPARNGTLTIGGQRFTVTQQQADCSFSISPAGQSFTTAGGQGSVTVSTSSACTWNTSDVPVWVTGMPASRMGPQTITFTVAPNPGSPRSANILIGGQSFAVSQTAGCSYSLAPGNHSPSAAGGASSFAVNTAAGCAWTSSGVPAWITGVPANGTGPQTINFTVAANNGATRSASIVIGGQTFTVTQAAVACNYSLNPTRHNPTAAGGASSVDLTTMAGCSWTSSGVPAWITGVPGSGTGTTTINFTVAANPDPAPRNASIIIGGRTFAVTQAAAAAPCSYALNPTSHNPTAAGGPSSVEVTTASACNWTSSGVPSWISGVPGSGTGTTTINFTVAANPDPAPRSASIIIGGQTFSVTQAAAAAPCSYALNPISHDPTAAGGASSFDVNTAAGCNWTSTGVPEWIKGVPEKGTGTQTIDFTVDANTGPARNASIVIGGQTFAISQASGCTYSVSPGSLTFGLLDILGKDVSLTTGPGCPWTATPSATWIRITSNSTGTGSGTITIQVDLLPFGERTGEVTVEGQKVTITQNGL